ncbi:RluA family pseudouridine synthase, partial [Bordetella holmesii]|nr:RluA family pseudouridine synthase [Bordetella holmesii]
MSDTAASAEPHSDDEPLAIFIPPDTPPDRLDKVLARLMPGQSLSRKQGSIAPGQVQENGTV